MSTPDYENMVMWNIYNEITDGMYCDQHDTTIGVGETARFHNTTKLIDVPHQPIDVNVGYSRVERTPVV